MSMVSIIVQQLLYMLCFLKNFIAGDKLQFMYKVENTTLPEPVSSTLNIQCKHVIFIQVKDIHTKSLISIMIKR